MHRDAVSTMLEQWAAERPDLDASPVGIIGRLSRVSQFVTEDLVALYRRFGLSEGEFDILATLRRIGAPHALAPSAIAGVTMVTKSAVSKRLDSLEAKGLVAREPDEHDGRGRVVRLTDAGRTLIDEAMPAHLENERGILAPLSERDRAALERILATWAEHYEARA
ncbi:MarR family transcriptional regulator [Agrococcus sp. ARC_14]|uniref:MarR family winged helix-turn-helix transcriptional regulator n=1 Tax=Agrococcus sp. ARC_14 TaxID=2919927 RepID=UPI001F05C938|nr:MarR family transcriptional regulator [Agrococcus sp. ARC_14]MCH1881728.1 MarR family transcriptional regulator [Agrococcus sp. ARC_14]